MGNGAQKARKADSLRRCRSCGRREADSVKRPYCKPCRNERDRLRYDPAKDRARHLKYWYGITIDQYRAIYAAQAGACAICESSESRLCVDHDHATGEVRALLCFGCNLLVGKVESETDRMKKIYAYLDFHGRRRKRAKKG